MQVSPLKLSQFVVTNKLVLAFDKPFVSPGTYLTIRAVHLEGALLGKLWPCLQILDLAEMASD